jgi:hypothetical protein
VTCQLEQYNGLPIIEAGDNVPSVHYKGVGYSKLDGVTALAVNLMVTSISPV